jgi:biofilm PGA synthesis lipoprotein PgaB
MFRKILFILACVISLYANSRFIVLCYHNIQDYPRDPDIMNLSTAKFLQQLNWLSANGYHPISIDDLIAAKKGLKKLPKKAVLLTFDDAYQSFYTRVYPILKAYHYPAVLAVVGKWLQAKKGEKFLYGNKLKKRGILLSWKEIKEMSDSGLVEVASHTYNLHHGVLANPQGNTEPAVTARIYNPKTKKYESDAHYRKRIEEDLEKNSELIYKKIGKRPRVIVWPFGEYNEIALNIAKKLGMNIAFTLDDGSNTLNDLDRIRRMLIFSSDKLNDIVWRIYKPDQKEIKRVVHIDLDYIYDPNPVQQEKNLGRLLDRIKAYKINTVYLQAFADPDGDGVANALYFPNRYMPVRADLFNRVAWQLRTRCGVEFIYAWLPISAFDVGNKGVYVESYDPVTKKRFINKKYYKRLSIFDSKSRKIIKGIYEDLAKYDPFNGILFHDDGFFTDYEDASNAALKVYVKNGFPSSIAKIRQNKQLFKKWTEFKTDALIDFTMELKKEVQIYRPELKTARNIYARVIMQPESEAWFAQNYKKFLNSYDYVAIMAMPYMENAKNPEKWLESLINKVKKYKNGPAKSVFELQSRNWRNHTYVNSDALAEQMRTLQINKILNYGYYPDDFLKNEPNFKIIYSVMSLEQYPFERR